MLVSFVVNNIYTFICKTNLLSIRPLAFVVCTNRSIGEVPAFAADIFTLRYVKSLELSNLIT